eukprot:scaffold62406_cov18-Prasinocladus_malaysianus.AAC.1
MFDRAALTLYALTACRCAGVSSPSTCLLTGSDSCGRWKPSICSSGSSKASHWGCLGSKPIAHLSALARSQTLGAGGQA